MTESDRVRKAKLALEGLVGVPLFVALAGGFLFLVHWSLTEADKAAGIEGFGIFLLAGLGGAVWVWYVARAVRTLWLARRGTKPTKF